MLVRSFVKDDVLPKSGQRREYLHHLLEKPAAPSTVPSSNSEHPKFYTRLAASSIA
jgi:hypothetical protein